MIRRNDEGRPTSPSWVQVYRELMEWAVLFQILRDKDFASDTIIVYDGLLRSKVFAGELFLRLSERFAQADRPAQEELAGTSTWSAWPSTRRCWTATGSPWRCRASCAPATRPTPRFPGTSKRRPTPGPNTPEGAKWPSRAARLTSSSRGRCSSSKFGPQQDDPIWPVDLFEPQTAQAPEILGALLADATEGFPVPYYPLCLQKAHENAALVDFDFDVIQDSGVRRDPLQSWADEAPRMDEFQLQARGSGRAEVLSG